MVDDITQTLYVSDSSNAIRMVRLATGVVETLAGSDGTTAGTDVGNTPYTLAALPRYYLIFN